MVWWPRGQTHLGVILNCAPRQMCDPGQIIGCHSAKMSSLKRGMLVSWGLNGLAWLQSFIMVPRIQQAEEGSEREMTPCLRMLSALTEDLNSVSSPHVTHFPANSNYSFGNSNTTFWPPRASALTGLCLPTPPTTPSRRLHTCN